MVDTSDRASTIMCRQRQSEDPWPRLRQKSQEEIDTVQEEIAKDIYEIVVFYKEEINRIMQEFDKHDIDTSVQSNHIEAEKISKTPGLGAPETSKSGPSTAQAHHENDIEEDSEDDDEDTEFQTKPKEEPSIFDILDDSDKNQQE